MRFSRGTTKDPYLSRPVLTDVRTLEPVPSVGTWSSTLCHTFTLGRADRSAQGVAGRVVSGPDALGRPPSCPAPSFVTCFSEKLGLLRRRPESLTLADSHQAGAQRVALCSVFLRLVVRAGGRATSGLRFRGTAVDGCGALLCRGQVVHPLRVPQHCWWAASRRHRTRPPVHVAQLCPPPPPTPRRLAGVWLSRRSPSGIQPDGGPEPAPERRLDGGLALPGQRLVSMCGHPPG